MSFVKPEEIRAFVVRGDYDGESTIFTMLEKASYAKMLAYTDRPALKCPDNDLLERYSHDNIFGYYLRLNTWPIMSITSIYPDDDTADALTSTDYTIFRREGKLHRYSGWKDPEYYWTVKWRGGYTNGDSGAAGVGSLNAWTDNAKLWAVDQWKDKVLTDSAKTKFCITSNTSTVLTISGTPASGAYQISGDDEYQDLKNCQLLIASVMWDDTGYKRFVVDQMGNVHGSLNYAISVNTPMMKAVLDENLFRYKRIIL